MTAAGPVVGIVDYGMGNRRSVEKALDRAGAQVLVSADHDALREADGLYVPGVGAFPAAMAALRERGLDVLLRERADAGVPVMGSCLGMQLLFERSDEHGGAEGLGLLPGSVVKLDTRGLKLPHIGWNEVRWMRETPAGRRPARPCRSLPRALVRAARSRTSSSSGWATTAAPFASVVGRDSVFGAQFHPEKSSTDGLALLRNFVGSVHGGGGVILYPAIDISEGKAVRLVQGRLRRRHRLRATIRSRPPAPGSRQGARFLHVVDLDGAQHRHAPSRSSTSSGSPPSCACRSSTAAACGRFAAVRDALRAGAERVILGTAAFTDVDFLDDVLGRVPRPRDRQRRHARRQRLDVGLAGDDADARRGGHRAPPEPRRALVRLHERRQGRDARGPRRRGGQADRVRRARPLAATPAASARSTTCGRCATLRQVNLGGVIVGKALYEGRFTVAEGQTALQPETTHRSYRDVADPRRD